MESVQQFRKGSKIATLFNELNKLVEKDRLSLLNYFLLGNKYFYLETLRDRVKFFTNGNDKDTIILHELFTSYSNYKLRKNKRSVIELDVKQTGNHEITCVFYIKVNQDILVDCLKNDISYLVPKELFNGLKLSRDKFKFTFKIHRDKKKTDLFLVSICANESVDITDFHHSVCSHTTNNDVVLLKYILPPKVIQNWLEKDKYNNLLKLLKFIDYKSEYPCLDIEKFTTNDWFVYHLSKLQEIYLFKNIDLSQYEIVKSLSQQYFQEYQQENKVDMNKIYYVVIAKIVPDSYTDEFESIYKFYFTENALLKLPPKLFTNRFNLNYHVLSISEVPTLLLKKLINNVTNENPIQIFSESQIDSDFCDRYLES